MTHWSRRTFLKTTAASGLVALPTARELAASEGSDGSPGLRWATADDPLGVRDQFPVAADLAYLNTASMGPVPIPVHHAMTAYAEERMMYRNPGSRREATERARERFAQLFGAKTEEVAMLFSTSDGENLVANAIDWRPGDNVVIDELHFSTAFVVFRELEKREGIELRIVPARDGRAPVEDFEARTDNRTRLISVAWVSNRNGYRHDLSALADLAHSRGGYLFADAIQAFGTFQVDLHEEGVDFACGNGYKWLFADYGCAPFYVREEHLSWMQPDRFGHSQIAEALPDHQYRLQSSAAKFQYSNASYGATTAMDAALEFLGDVGLDRIADHTQALAGDLRNGVAEMGLELFTPPNTGSSIVSFYHGLEPQTVADALMDEGVRFTFQEQGRLIRTAVALFNNRDDVDRLLGVLRGLV